MIGRRWNLLPAFLSLCTICATAATCSAQQARPTGLLTTAEASNYTKTSRQADVVKFLSQLTAHSSDLTLQPIGVSVETRPIQAVIAARPPLKVPLNLTNDPRLVIFLVGNIHAGECAGKEAILGLLRDLAAGRRKDWLKQFVIVAIPNFNVDGNERQGAAHRPGQLGPSGGMGIRENAQGLDLNRDFIKLETPEVKSLVAAIDEWNPHLFIDTHTTNGSRHRYALTYDPPHNPASPSQTREWLRTDLLPKVTAALAENHIETFFYGNFNADKTRWTTFGHQPRYSTEYVGLRGRLAILSEAYTYISYRDRITAHREFISKTLDEVGRQSARVRKLCSSLENKHPREVAIRSENSPYPEKVLIKGYRQGKSPKPSETPKRLPTEETEDYQVAYHANFKPTQTAQRPFAYLLDADESRVAQRLKWHGIDVHALQSSQRLPLRRCRVTEIKRDGPALQGHRLTNLNVTWTNENVTLPKTSYVVFTNQPNARLISYLLEPESDDGLTAWNFFDPQLRKGDFHPVSKLMAATELKVHRLEKIRPSAQLTLDKIYGPRGRVPFGGSFPLSLKWIPKTTRYTLRRQSQTFHVDADTAERFPVKGINQEKVQQALVKLGPLDKKQASKLTQRGGESSPDGKATLYVFENDLILYQHTPSLARRLTTDKLPKKLITFSPDSSHIAFIKKDNIFALPVSGGEPVRLTTDGSPEQLYGYLDWVYQEEVYGRGNFRGFWWSPDSEKIAFLHLDERPVSKYTIADHLAYREKSNSTYYPKAGDPLPKVALAVFSLPAETTHWVDLDRYGKEFLISRVSWSPTGKNLYFQVQNREQTWLDLCKTEFPTNRTERLFRDTTDAWIQSPGDPLFLTDQSFLWLTEKSGYRHIEQISADGRRRIPLTTGPWEIQKLLGVNKATRFVYFMANREKATETHGYRVSLDERRVERLTKTPGNHSLRFNDSFTHYLDYVSQLHRPISVSLSRADGTNLRTLAPNLVDHLDYYELNHPEFISFPARDGRDLNAILIKPPNFDPQKRYPVICHVYGGPQAPVARNRWSGTTYLWHQYMAQQGYLIWICDNRAATHEGVQGAWPIHHEMGRIELQDVEDGAKWLGTQSWVDPNRIGIWGWSYGGYLVSYTLTHSKLFKAGIAGAPVTDWRNYDAIYTERYMGLPKDNKEGYKNASPVHAAANLHGTLLLIHGSLDDNVHLANTLQFSNALQNAGKQFQLMIYPNNRHGISRSQQSRHLRDLMTKFFRDNL